MIYDMITTKEIAERLGVSRSTVSRVLNNNPHVNENTRERVLRELKKMNYIPNEVARSLIMRKVKRVAFIGFSEPIYFWDTIRLGIAQAEKEFSHKGLHIEYFESDINKPQEQLDIVLSLLDKSYDGIILTPNDPLIMKDIIDKAVDLSIPVVLCNLDIPDSKRTCFVGCDHYLSGRLGGEFFSKLTGNRPNTVTLFTIADNITSIKQRDQGFLDEIKRNSHIKIQDILTFKRTGSDIYSTAKELITQGVTDSIFISIAGLEDIAKAIHDLQMNGKLTLIGYDLNPHIRNYINNYAITATIYHHPQKQSYLAVAAIFELLYHNKAPESTIQHTNLELIMRHNLPKVSTP